jgi:signal transduction histidine kinase/CheY-like chemotaxis protein
VTAPSTPTDRLAEWRSHLLERILRWGVVTLFLPWIAGTWASLDADLRMLAGLGTGGYVVLGCLAFVPGLSFRMRAVGLLAISWVVGVGVILQVGPLGAGALWLAAVPVLASFLFGMPGAGMGIGVLVLTVGTLAIPAMGTQGLGPPDGVGPGARYELVSWLATSGSMVGLAMLLALPFAFLLRRFEGALARETEARVLLEAEALRREELETELRQAHKMEALGTFAGGIAHDFNNLLVPMLADAEELRTRAGEDPEAGEAADRIVRAATRSRELVRGILAFSRRDESTREAVPMGPILEEVASLTRVATGPGASVSVHVAEGTPPAACDPFRLHQALVNLATNARQALPDGGGTIRLEARGTQAGGAVLLEVLDSGTGMDPETLERAMDPFFTTRPPGVGTGLGLSSALGVIRSMGGRLELRSRSGEGTTARILLPAWGKGEPSVAEVPEAGLAPAATATTTATGAAGADPGGRPGILLVDDDPLVRTATRRLLERMGYEVEEAESAEEALLALARLEADARLPGLVLTDRTMPGMDGIALAREVNTRLPALPVVLVTGNLEGAGGGPGGKAPPPRLSGTLQKPFTRGELEASIEQAMGNPEAPGDYQKGSPSPLETEP